MRIFFPRCRGWAHAVVLAQCIVAPRQQLLLGLVIEGGGQAVGAVFLGPPPIIHAAFCKPDDSAMKFSPPSTTST